jgi:peptidoglycan/xylan/chitin deacetylase (PgdA/CDA1 family)
MKQIFSMDVERSMEGALRLSKLLERHGLTGEFFVCGELVAEHPKEVKEIARKHVIGGHGFHHEDFSRMSYKSQLDTVIKTRDTFESAGVEMVGWRFPFLLFKNESMKIITKLKLFDSSIRSSDIERWGGALFVRNWMKNAIMGNFSAPVRYPANLDERSWDFVDLGSEEFWKMPGRLILHSYNFGKFEKDIDLWLKNRRG